MDEFRGLDRDIQQLAPTPDRRQIVIFVIEDRIKLINRTNVLI